MKLLGDCQSSNHSPDLLEKTLQNKDVISAAGLLQMLLFVDVLSIINQSLEGNFFLIAGKCMVFVKQLPKWS